MLASDTICMLITPNAYAGRLLRSFTGLSVVLAALNGCEGDSEEAYPPEMLGKDSSISDTGSAETTEPDTAVVDTSIEETAVDSEPADSTLADSAPADSTPADTADTSVDTAETVGPTCTDTVKNGTETDVDCGGTCPTKCDDTKICSVAGDCKSGVCAGGKCAAPLCTDVVKNGTETDVDCGGTCPAKCDDGKTCGGAADCKSGVCTAGTCVGALCSDLVKNGTETDVDCGGTCPTKCNDGKACGGATDCKSGVCTGGVCQAPLCTDVVKNGTETDVDCGGTCPTKCDDGKSCGVVADCKSGVCTGGVCLAPFCTDLVKNGTETDVDCGGTTCGKCGGFKTCAIAGDCLSGVCGSDKKCACAVGLSACSGTCVDLTSDPTNCGLCGKVCTTGSCVASNCLPPGSLDPTFGGGNGWVRYQPNGFHNEWYALAMNPDDTLVLAGRNQVAGADEDWVVSKLKVDGNFDGTFGTGGNLHISAGAIIGERAKGIVRATDGSFYVAGTLYKGTTHFDMAVAKVTAAGALDATYGTSGITTRANTGEDAVEGMHLYADGSVLVVGRAGPSGTGADMQLVRFLPSGAVDTSFGTGGVVTWGTAGVQDEALGVAVDSAGKIVVVGFSDNDSVILKYSSNGTLDWAKTLDLSGATKWDQLRRVRIGAGDSIVAAGLVTNVDNDFVVVRYSSAGVADATFGTAGKVFLDRGATGEQQYALTIAPSGDILVGGTSGSYPAAVARLKPNGTLDTTFGIGGWFTNSFASFASNVNAIAFDSKGRIVIAGSWAQSNPDWGAARLIP